MDEYRSSESNKRPSIFWPVLLVAAGIILLLNTTGAIQGNTWDMLWRLWPLLLVVGGLDGLYRRDGFVGPVVFIGVGTIFLLGNLGYLSIGGFWLLLRFWPVLLIAFGLDLVIGRRTPLAPLIGLFLGLLLIAGIVWLSLGMGGMAVLRENQPISQPLQEAQRGDVTLTLIGGTLHLEGGAERGDLIAGELEHNRSDSARSSYSVNDGVGRYRLESTAVNVFAPTGASTGAQWDLQLSSRLPLDLNSQLVFGEQEVDLEDVQADTVRLQTVFGKSTVSLPREGDLAMDTSVVFGQLVVRVPEGAAVRINADTGIGSTHLPDDFQREGNWYVSPAAAGGGAASEIKTDVAFGSLVVEEY
ncbi:MAG: hypothetical protein GYA17_18900 [Chloroflexi bacterium]|nr:hypothetical protein [Chloroflexota bacterium]